MKTVLCEIICLYWFTDFPFLVTSSCQPGLGTTDFTAHSCVSWHLLSLIPFSLTQVQPLLSSHSKLILFFWPTCGYQWRRASVCKRQRFNSTKRDLPRLVFCFSFGHCDKNPCLLKKWVRSFERPRFRYPTDSWLMNPGCSSSCLSVGVGTSKEFLLLFFQVMEKICPNECKTVMYHQPMSWIFSTLWRLNGKQRLSSRTFCPKDEH